MIKIDENDPIGEVDPSFPYRDVSIKRNTDMKEFYNLQKEIGRGKFGTVYRCTEKSTGLKLAAKFIGISKRQDRRNAEREVEIMRELQHPRLIQMYDAYEINNVMCVILELIEGGELFERVIDDDFVLTEKSVSVFMRQICEGIAFIHSKDILHLDMKPENILCLTRTGNRIKIIDFGLARKYDPQKKLQVLFGTPEFVAPEVVNFDSIGFGTDMWSVGVICYVLLSGLSPFMGETDVQTMANVTIAQYDFDDEAFNDISADAKDFIGKLLLKDREQRMSATECLSHHWLQRRKPVSGVNPSSNPIPQNTELDIQRDKPTLRHLVDRWNNDTNIMLVNGDVNDHKHDKIIDICKTMNGITDEQSKLQNMEGIEKVDFVAQNNNEEESKSMAETNEKAKDDDEVQLASPIPKKQIKLESTLEPIESIEAPAISNQVLKTLIDDVDTEETTPIIEENTLAVDPGGKESDTKIRKSSTPQTSTTSSPRVIEHPVLNDKLKLCNGYENFISTPMEEQTYEIEKNSDDKISSKQDEGTSESDKNNDDKIAEDQHQEIKKLANCDKSSKHGKQDTPVLESLPPKNSLQAKGPASIVANEDEHHNVQTNHIKFNDIPNGDLAPEPHHGSKSRSPVVEICDESYECVKKRRFVIKNVESTTSTRHVELHESHKDSDKTTPLRKSPLSPEREHSPKVFSKFNDLMSTSELMKRRISDISSLLSKTEQKLDHSFSEDMSSFCHKLNKIVRLRHDSYSIETDGSTFKRPKFRISYFSRDVPLASSAPYHADLLNYLPLCDETASTPVWSFQKTNPFHSDPSSLRNSPERFGNQPSLTKKILSKFFSDSLEYDISSSTPSSSHGLPKDKITGIIS